jgi:hypothetical protein
MIRRFPRETVTELAEQESTDGRMPTVYTVNNQRR